MSVGFILGYERCGVIVLRYDEDAFTDNPCCS